MEVLGLRIVRLYDARASCLSSLADNGVPDHILARWAGHTNVKTTRKWCVKPHVEDLREAASTWEGLHGELNGRVRPATYHKAWVSVADRSGPNGFQLCRPGLRHGATRFAANSERLVAVLVKEAARRHVDRARVRPAGHAAAGAPVHAERLKLER